MLDHATCYAASAGRDVRFDGQFVMAVRTTGIYCRPSCPARTPKPGNVEFYRTSAAAHVAGFRACKRCLPEAVPGSPEWSVREDVAARAMRLIGEGVVDRDGVPGLASRLGYSERQLNRVLADELGASPVALARAQRAQNARRLLVGTSMQVADVAFAAGFQSLRQFNDTVAEVFGMTPTQVRGTARAADRVVGLAEDSTTAAGGSSITVRLAAREPFAGADVIEWLAARAVAGVEVVDGLTYRRSALLAGGPAVLSATPDAAGVTVTASLTRLADLPEALARVRRLFDLDADPGLIDGHLARAASGSPALLAHLEQRPGARIAGAVEPSEMVVRAILGQQVTVKAARTALSALADSIWQSLPDELASRGVTRLFPDAAAVAASARLDPGDGGAVRGPAARRRALASACEAIASGAMRLDAGTTRERLTADLEALPGIGPWTSQYVAMRVLGSPDSMLTGDVAVRAGARRVGLPDAPRDLLAATANFAPWRTYLMLHLWRAATPAPSPIPQGVAP